MKKIFTLLLLVLPLFLAKNSAQVYKDKTAPVDERVSDLLSRMTLDEKLAYIGGYNSFYIMGISRLGVPAIKMSDGPLGVRNYGGTTAYPAGVLNAASWDTAVLNNNGHGFGKDARARGVHIVLAPGMNIYLIPVNGRNFEYYGEDPYLASRMAVSFIKGIQSEGVMATPKHFAVNNFERNRSGVNIQVDERTLNEIYFPAFKASVQEGKAGTIMAAYNKLNGAWCAQNDFLLNKTLKGDWNFNGFVMSDWGATHNALQAAQGGLDLEMPAGDNMNKANLSPYLNNGTLQVSDIDDKVRRILHELFTFGFFDRNQTISTIPLDNPETNLISLNAARGGIVLLKNNGILPLGRDTVKSIAVFGDLANQYVAGGGSSYTTPNHYITVLQGIDSLAGNGIKVSYNSVTTQMDQAYQNSVFYTDNTLSTAGLIGQYFNNKTLTGTPTGTRTDTHVNFAWENDPGVTGIGADNFSIRWTGYINPTVSANYLFSVKSDDGFRLYVDDTLLMEDWSDHAATVVNKSKFLSASAHKIRLDYYENGGLSEIRFGYENADTATNGALQAAASADVAVVCAGFGSDNEGEGWDRSFELPASQADLINSVAAVNKNTIVILFAGGAVETGSWMKSAKAVVDAFYPGQAGGMALGEILFGNVNPSGKLPFSFDSLWTNNPVYKDYNAAGGNDQVKYSEGLFVGYRFYDTAKHVRPLFPFGYGLSYTKFDYSNLKLTLDNQTDFQTVQVKFDLKNSGQSKGKEIAQVYVRALHPSVLRPYKELKGFNKIELDPGQTQTLQVNLNKSAFKYYSSTDHQWVFEPDTFVVMVGASSQDIRLVDTIVIKKDMTRPEVVSMYPPNGETYIPLQPAYKLQFSENVTCAGTSFYIRKYSDSSIVDTIETSELTGCGTNTLTFSSTKLQEKTQYFVEIPEGFFVGEGARPFSGFTTRDNWNFKTLQNPPTSIYTVKPNEAHVYPNPARNQLFIDANGISKIYSVEITNIDGSIVLQKSYNKNEETLVMDISKIPNGLYLLKINGKKISETHKIVVNH